MWFFMISCYILTLISFFFFILNALQGYFQFKIFAANHSAFALLTIMIYLFTETLIIFYFVGIGISIKEYTADNKLSHHFHQRSLKIKRWVYPPILLNILLFMILFISGGAVDTNHMPGWLHGLLFYICFFHFIKMTRLEHRAFQESTSIVLEMSGVRPHGITKNA